MHLSLLPPLPYPIIMKLVAAYLLASLGSGSNRPPTSKVVEILRAAEADFSEAEVDELVKEIQSKGDLDEVIAEGKSKFASMPAVGAVSGGAVGGAVGGGPAVAAAVAEPEPEPEEEDDDMGFSLFD